eukprot:CAMPEP_0206197394 /NCGR_PEP_ID=MMETSP0166-20121206/9028_1 /ASSEMBLY_ACC=CAM_ASM_000260 /TAXON_ID=95228 /ORGANISM="Vannella robusta, Strain DIVA3 518/3/11/1/6" /LENGTH=180 /DNA_ID=CAMNT_0053615073 /DNA_START=62 /DNA_END=604 /DNA_ORIENTATION=+
MDSSDGRGRRRKPVERLGEDEISTPVTRLRRSASVSKSPATRGRKRPLEDATENEAKKAKYSHENDEEEKYEEILSLSGDPSKSTQKTISEAFSATRMPGSKNSTDSLLRQILARLELLRQQHKQTERQIQYIIDESSSDPDMFIVQQAKLSQTETENNASMSGELMVNLRAISKLLQRD